MLSKRVPMQVHYLQLALPTQRVVECLMKHLHILLGLHLRQYIPVPSQPNGVVRQVKLGEHRVVP